MTDRNIFIALADAFSLRGELTNFTPISRGHIHDTFLITFQHGSETKRYIQQRLNTNVFENVDLLMSNIATVVDHIAEAKATDPELAFLEVPEIVKTSNGDTFSSDSSGSIWRTMSYIPDTKCFDVCESNDIAYQAGNICGLFERALSDLKAGKLGESIPKFRDLPNRFVQLENACQSALGERLKAASESLSELERLQEHADILEQTLSSGAVPQRATHNDLKLNNILFDQESLRARALIDLDTCMPGNLPFDFGNLAVFCCVDAKEDEKDLSRLSFNIEYFEQVARGFINPLKDRLEPEELNLFALGPLLFALNDGVRFLTDYLSGDLYFKVDYDEHNLVRARNRIGLAKVIEEEVEELEGIVQEIGGE